MLEPVLGQLHLPAVGDLLAEQAVIVADAIAVSRNVEAGHALHEAGGETTEAAVAQSGIGLQRLDEVNVDVEPGQRLGEGGSELEVAHRVTQQAADEEFQRQVIDPLGIGLVGALGRFHPAVDDAVAQRQDGGVEPVMALGHGGVLADRIGKLLEDFGADGLGVAAARGWLDHVSLAGPAVMGPR